MAFIRIDCAYCRTMFRFTSSAAPEAVRLRGGYVVRLMQRDAQVRRTMVRLMQRDASDDEEGERFATDDSNARMEAAALDKQER